MKFPFLLSTLVVILISVFVLPESNAYGARDKYDSYTYQKITSQNRKIKRTKKSIRLANRKNRTGVRNRMKRKLRKQRIVLRKYEGRTILGRWIPQGFESSTRYEFTRTTRFAIWSDDGVFPTLADFLHKNPGLSGNSWSYEGRTVVVDLNFGNYSRLIPQFSGNNNMVNWINEDGELHSTFYREK